MQAQAQLQGGEPAPAQPAAPQGGAPIIPQGLAANLPRLAIKPQGGKASGISPGSNLSTAPGSAPGPPPCSAAWEDKLNANTAAMAGNAEDFTKEFMKQLTGGQ